jgi:hypothetical protein
MKVVFGFVDLHWCGVSSHAEDLSFTVLVQKTTLALALLANTA